MPRRAEPARIVRPAGEPVEARWGPFVLRSAFQPIFAIREGHLVATAFEALARPFRDGNALGAAEFLAAVPVAERFGVERLLRQSHILNAGAFLPREALLFVNFDPSLLSGRSLAEAALRDVALVLEEAGIEPARLVCEVTEQKLSSERSVLRFLDALRETGCRIAVDDYGAAYSDMERIRLVRPDIVKLDARWSAGLMESGTGFMLLAMLAAELSGRGIETVLEGIEDERQLALAERAGVSMVQGYALRRPELAPTSFGAMPVRAGTDGPDLRAVRPTTHQGR